MTQQAKQKPDGFEIVTNRIIQHLEQGAVPWKQPWTTAFPQNLVSQRQYRGVNVLLLHSLGYNKNYFLTSYQMKKLGATLKQGEQACPVIYWDRSDETIHSDGKQHPILRNYLIYNVEQCDGIPESSLPLFESEQRDSQKELCEYIVDNMPNMPEIKFKENRPFYHPYHDFINMPRKKTFADEQSYYDALFREMIHSTGHVSRLKRKEVTQLKSLGCEEYSIEELIAEIGVWYLYSYAGMRYMPSDCDKAYIEGWLEKLKSDKRMMVFASGKAQQAVDYILSVNQPTS